MVVKLSNTAIMTILKLLLLLKLFSSVISYNINVDSALFYHPNREVLHYNSKPINFGFSISSYPNNLWFLVGAPKSNTANSFNHSVSSPGTVFKCILSQGNETCSEIYDEDYKNSNVYYDHQMYGATTGIFSDDFGNDQVVICAHTTKYQGTYLTLKDKITYGKFTKGLCFLRNVHGLTEISLAEEKSFIRQNDFHKFYAGQAVMGMSLHMNYDKKLLIGSPGLMQWSGGVVIHFNNSKCLYVDKSSHEDSYVGYAVFSAKQKNFESIVLGAPRYGLYGKVIILNMSLDCKGVILQEIQEKKFGSYFGATLLALDVNNDGIDELLVGAPFYNYSMGDEGAVFVYKKVLERYQKVGMLTGNKKPGSRFGYSVHGVGDINLDGFLDIIVGAPYEKTGVIYLYLGKDAIFENKYSQRIEAMVFNPKLEGFGFTISALFDDKSYAAIAVGSPASDVVTLLRTNALHHISVKFHFSSSKISWEPKSCNHFYNHSAQINVSLLFYYNISSKELQRFGHQLFTGSEILYDLIVDHPFNRGLLISKENRKVKKLREKVKFIKHSISYEQNWTIKFYFMDQPRNILEPVKLNLNISNPSALNSSHISMLMLDPRYPTNFSGQIFFADLCENNNCHPKFTWRIHQEFSKTYIIGSRVPVVIALEVHNSGGFSNRTRFIVKHPDWLLYDKLNTSKHCHEINCLQNLDNTSITCEVSAVVKTNASLRFDLYLRKKVPSDDFNDHVKITSEIVESSSEKIKIEMPTVYQSEIVYRKGSRDTQTNESYKMLHFCDIRNKGPGVHPILYLFVLTPELPNGSVICCTNHSIKVNVKREFSKYHHTLKPSRIEIKQKIDLLQYLRQSPYENSNVSVNCESVHCVLQVFEISNVMPEDSLDIFIEILIEKKLYSLINKFWIFNYASEIMLSPNYIFGMNTSEFNHTKDWPLTSLQINSILSPPSKPTKLPFWIFVLCILIGLIHLAILVFVLKKCGFFHRASREKLLEEKQKFQERTNEADDKFECSTNE